MQHANFSINFFDGVSSVTCYKLTNHGLPDLRKKRAPARLASGKREVYVTRTARYSALRARIMTLLDASPQPVVLHSMGAALIRCCDLALEIERCCKGGVKLAVETDTVCVIDDHLPLVPVRKSRRMKVSARIGISVKSHRTYLSFIQQHYVASFWILPQFFEMARCRVCPL